VDRSRWLLVGGLALAVLGVWGLAAALGGRMIAQPDGSAVTVLPTSGPPTTPPVTLSPPPSPTTAPTSTATAAPTPTPTASSTQQPTAAPTEAPEGDPRLLFVEFQLRLADAGKDVQALNQALVAAAEAQDDPATVAAAVDMLDFVDRERDWLAGHPPAACYDRAHAAAAAMLRDYGAVAEAAIAYADATGLERLEALGTVLERAEVAGAALRTLEAALEDATCLA
jgi:hypothetical protein